MKIKLLMFLLILICLSCSGDDVETDHQYVGTWELVELRLSNPYDGNDDGIISANLVEELDCLFNTIQLKNDFSYSRNFMQIMAQGFTGELFEFQCTEIMNSNGTYSITEEGILLNGEDILYFEGENLMYDGYEPDSTFERIVYSKTN